MIFRANFGKIYKKCFENKAYFVVGLHGVGLRVRNYGNETLRHTTVQPNPYGYIYTNTHTQNRFQINVWNEHDNLFWRAYSFRPFVYKQTHKHAHIQTYAHTYVCRYMQHLLEIVRNSIRAETWEQAYCQGVNGWQVLSGGGILQTQAKFSTFGIHTVTTITTTTSKNKNFKKLQQAQRIHGYLFRVAGSLVAFGKLLLKLVSFRGIFFRIMPLAPQALWKCF